MHLLKRDGITPPVCLSNLQHGRDTWNDVTPEMRKEIRVCLERLQGRLCAYCEGSLDQFGAHIEHFRCRHHHPEKTFEWANLLWACDRSDSCGHHKQSFDSEDLIDPTLDDPDRLFRFNSNGTISIRQGLAPAEQRRAEETIRILNLDAQFGRLRRMRELVARGYLFQEPDIMSALADFSPEERQEFVVQELARTSSEPFCTVIRHLFEGLVQ